MSDVVAASLLETPTVQIRDVSCAGTCLARALDLLPQYDDLTALGLDLGFASHSHFTTAFRQVYGRSPSEFRQSIRRR